MASKYRLLHVIDHLGSGGAQESIVNYLKYGQRQLFQPEVAALHGFGHYWQVYRSWGVPVYSLVPYQAAAPAVPLIMARLWGLLRRNRYAIMHCHTLAANIVATTTAALGRVPLRINHDRTNEEVRYRNRSMLWLDTLGNSLATHIIAGSSSIRTFLCREEKLPADKITVIYNGVDLERFSPEAHGEAREKWRRALGFPPDSLVVGGVGRLHPQKDFHTFIEVAAGVSARIPEAVFVIAGDGPDRAALEELSRKLGLAARVKFLGFVKEMPELYRALDLLLFTSRYEGTCLTVLEALAMGLPLVCSQVDGPAELLKSGREALLVPPGQKELFVEEVCRVLQDRSFAQGLAQAGQAKVRGHHSVKAVIQRVEAFYLQCLEGIEHPG